MFLIPHKIVLVPPSSLSASNEKLACVADRENGRIQCFSIPYGYFKFQIRLDEFNGRLFSVSYSNTDRTLYAVAGPSLSDPNKDVLGFAFNVDTQQLKAMFAPNIGVRTISLCKRARLFYANFFPCCFRRHSASHMILPFLIPVNQCT